MQINLQKLLKRELTKEEKNRADSNQFENFVDQTAIISVLFFYSILHSSYLYYPIYAIGKEIQTIVAV